MGHGCVGEGAYRWGLSLFNFTTFLYILATFSVSHTHFEVTVLGRQPHPSARYALIMQDNSQRQYLTNPMDSPPELSQSSYSSMGFEGDGSVR